VLLDGCCGYEASACILLCGLDQTFRVVLSVASWDCNGRFISETVARNPVVIVTLRIDICMFTLGRQSNMLSLVNNMSVYDFPGDLLMVRC
jgi:hypothetical protein